MIRDKKGFFRCNPAAVAGGQKASKTFIYMWKKQLRAKEEV